MRFDVGRDEPHAELDEPPPLEVARRNQPLVPLVPPGAIESLAELDERGRTDRLAGTEDRVAPAIQADRGAEAGPELEVLLQRERAARRQRLGGAEHDLGVGRADAAIREDDVGREREQEERRGNGPGTHGLDPCYHRRCYPLRVAPRGSTRFSASATGETWPCHLVHRSTASRPWRSGPSTASTRSSSGSPSSAPSAPASTPGPARKPCCCASSRGGLVGWGECVADPDPYYAYETTTTARHIIRDFLLPLRRAGADARRARARVPHGSAATGWRRRRSRTRCSTCSRSARGRPAARAARRAREADPVGDQHRPAGVGRGAARRRSPRRSSAGYHRVKMKIMRGRDVDWVRGGARALPRRSADGRRQRRLHAWPTPSTCAQLDAFGLTMIEQPLSYSDISSTRSSSAAWRRRSASTSRSTTSTTRARRSTLGACRDHQHQAGARRRAAGGGPDRRGVRRARRPRLVGRHGRDRDRPRGQHPPPDGRRASRCPATPRRRSRYFHEDIVEPPVVLDADGFIEVPHGPGIGVTVLEDRVARHRIDEERLR